MNYEELLLKLAEENDKLIIMTAENRAAIRNLPSKIKDRFIDTGIAEQTMVGMSAGLALRGRIPVLHALSTFLTMRAFEFIRTDIGISGLPVKLVGAVAGFLSEANGPTHQAIEDIALMRGIPGMNVFCPSDEEELIQGMPSVINDSHPWYIRYNNIPASVKHAEFEIGKAEILSTGTDITFLTYGFLLKEVIAAADILRSEGISTGVINMRTLKPFDSKAIIQAANESTLIVPVEDHLITGGLYSVICETLIQNHTQAEIMPVALFKWFKPSLLASVLEYEGYTGKALANKSLVKFQELKNSKYELTHGR